MFHRDLNQSTLRAIEQVDSRPKYVKALYSVACAAKKSDTLKMMLAIIGIVLGTLTALGLYLLFRQWRLCALTPVAVIGWLLALLAVLGVASLTQAYLVMRNDPLASMGPFWGMLALMLGVLLLVCASIGFIHRWKLQISWFKAFGVLMAEAGAALLSALFLNQMLYPIADVLRGNSRDTGQILDSFAQARYLVSFFDLTLIFALLLLEVFGHFIRRRIISSPTKHQHSIVAKSD